MVGESGPGGKLIIRNGWQWQCRACESVRSAERPCDPHMGRLHSPRPLSAEKYNLVGIKRWINQQGHDRLCWLSRLNKAPPGVTRDGAQVGPSVLASAGAP